MKKETERFVCYTKVDTQSNESSSTCPSASKELDLTKILLAELEELGIKGEIDQYGRLYAHLAGEKGLDPIGLNAHVDTASEASGKDVKARYIENYDGGVIKLNDSMSMSPAEFPGLKKQIGKSLLVTDGTTLLGGDDKAGLAIIMNAVEYFVKHPEVKHHPLCLLFTPDEEIGRGPEHFDKDKFGASYAYTIDGAEPENIESENFNAAHADISITGCSIHPGEAKGKLVNAIRLMEEFDSLIHVEERPEYTELYEGFNHLIAVEGGAEKVNFRYIIRNHDRAKLEAQKNEFREAKEFLENKYPRAKVELTVNDDYRNMKEVLDKDPRALQRAKEVYAKLGIKYTNKPIRGGTDGATFSFKGCPTPDLGTGSYNHHGPYEYLSEEDFLEMIKIVIELVKA